MAESEFSQENVAAIRTHINNLEQMVRFQIGANRENRAAVEERLSARAGLPALYLALEDGPKTQAQLAAALNLNQSNISRGLKELLDIGLVTAVPPSGTRRFTTYVWSSVESVLGVSRIARGLLAGKGASHAKPAKVTPVGNSLECQVLILASGASTQSDPLPPDEFSDASEIRSRSGDDGGS